MSHSSNRFASPLKIAHGFSRGFSRRNTQVPSGTKELLCRPSGTFHFECRPPSLERLAIFSSVLIPAAPQVRPLCSNPPAPNCQLRQERHLPVSLPAMPSLLPFRACLKTPVQGVTGQFARIWLKIACFEAKGRSFAPDISNLSPQDCNLARQDCGFTPQNHGFSPKDCPLAAQESGFGQQERDLCPQNCRLAERDWSFVPRDDPLCRQKCARAGQKCGLRAFYLLRRTVRPARQPGRYSLPARCDGICSGYKPGQQPKVS